MYFLNVLLSLICVCNYNISASDLQTTKMEEMISIDCDAEPIKLCIKSVTKDFDLYKKRKFLTRLLNIENFFRTDNDTCESFKNPATLKYEVTDPGLKLCEYNCCENNKFNAINYNQKISIVISQLLRHNCFNVQMEAICENVGKCVWKKQKKIFECKCEQNYQILVTEQLNIYLNYFKENEVCKNLAHFNPDQIFAGYMFLLKCQPKTASKYLEWWIKQLQNFRVEENRLNTYPGPYNFYGRNEETNKPFSCLRNRYNHGQPQSTNNYFCCFIFDGSPSDCCSCGSVDNGQGSLLDYFCCINNNDDNGSLLDCCFYLLDSESTSTCLDP